MLDPEYAAFLAAKAPRAQPCGMEPHPMPAHMFGFQAEATRFCLRQGRAALFLDTGLGKSLCSLEFAYQAGDASNGCSLILTPLAVARQFEREAEKFGYSARVVRDDGDVRAGINICNYDRLDKLDTSRFGAVVLDESAILKSSTGAVANELIARFADTPFRLCATATPAPNDHTELGRHAEFLGYMTQADMLIRWFINDTGQASQHWRLKRHAVRDFWDWVASWAVMAETPADLGFEAEAARYVLPELKVIRHRAAGDTRAPAGLLFSADLSATNMHDIKRQTADARAEAVAALVAAEPAEPWVIWADTDYEADALLARMPDVAEIRGSQSIERKEQMLADFSEGRVRVLITKAGITGAGVNWQHCARMAYVGRSFSYEAWYQSVRRCWRFGQTRPVHVHLIVAEGEEQIGRVIERKAEDHAKMKRAMREAARRANGKAAQVKVPYVPTFKMEMPEWLA